MVAFLLHYELIRVVCTVGDTKHLPVALTRNVLDTFLEFPSYVTTLTETLEVGD